MRITKYEHATLTVDKGGDRVIIDPGVFLTTLTDFANITAVVITHLHPDHWTPRHLTEILELNPGVPIYGPQGVADAAADFAITVVAPGDEITVGDFRLRFFGGQHAVIHESLPRIDNVGVVIDDKFAYPGDSFDVPHAEIQLLAAPLGAPWLKVSEAMDYVLAVAPRHAFGTHDMTLSTAGRTMHHERLTWATEQNGGQYRALEPGESVDI